MKKLSVPVITGLAFVGLDMIFWINWAYLCIAGKPICGEQLMAAYVLHFPSSWLPNLIPFFASVPTNIEIGVFFILGTLQYFLIGCVLGWLGRGVYQLAKKHIELV